MKTILPYHHPTTVVFVDDHVDMLEDLIRLLGLKNKPYKTFDNPKEALTHINADNTRQNFIDKLTQVEEDQLGFPRDIFARELLNPQRYQQISIMVVDYEMPGMNGLQLCKEINNPFIKKILLTGVADESIAIDAFNQGVIQQYIRKQDSNFVEHIHRAIQSAQQAYFREISEMVLKIIASLSEPASALFDPAFQNYFGDIISKNAIEEYYLVEETGSFLMVDKKQKIHALMAVTDVMIDCYLDSASAERLTASEREDVKQRKVVPCYYHPYKKPNLEADDLARYLRKPTVIQGEKETFYTVFGQGLIPVSNEEVALFSAKKKLWA